MNDPMTRKGQRKIVRRQQLYERIQRSRENNLEYLFELTRPYPPEASRRGRWTIGRMMSRGFQYGSLAWLAAGALGGFVGVVLTFVAPDFFDTTGRDALYAYFVIAGFVSMLYGGAAGGRSIWEEHLDGMAKAQVDYERESSENFRRKVRGSEQSKGGGDAS